MRYLGVVITVISLFVIGYTIGDIKSNKQNELKYQHSIKLINRSLIILQKQSDQIFKQDLLIIELKELCKAQNELITEYTIKRK